MPIDSTHGRAHPDHDTPSGAVGTVSPTVPVAYVVRQLADVVDALSDDQYRQHPIGPFQSPIGSQVRHCLDHVRAFLDGVATGAMDYDRRDRGTPVENDRAVAVRLTHELADGLLTIDPAVLERPVRLTVMLSKDDRGLDVESTFGRELAFVLSHTIHHGAMIGAMARILDVDVPKDFGFAPSTLAFLGQE